ncbi:MAG: DUF2461 domain-containing protein [Cytophagaceae bacterium]|jgi:uncharacterized protein (TIGR02453 family)|nr:DUF2461 domain-containing protein [Cytophagaceae bacterium]
MKQTFDFLKKLKKNNTKEWFDDHRSEYELVKKQMQEWLLQFIPKVEKLDTSIQDLAPKDCMFRINRDVRFSKNKDPYKTNMGVVFAPGGKKSTKGCYYVHIEPGNCFIAGGIWMPEPEALQKIRQEIDYNGSALQTIVRKKSFQKYFIDFDSESTLTRVPKGYAADHEYADWLKLKSFTVTYPIDDSVLLSADRDKLCLAVFKEILPINQFLTTALD